MEPTYSGPGAMARAEAVGIEIADGRRDPDTTRPGARQAPTLWPYQVEIISRLDEALAAGKRRPLIVMPTASGKTVVLGEIIRRAAARQQRVLLLAHRRELITQASRELYAAGVDHGIVEAGFPSRPHVPVQVASIATLWARAVRGSAMELPAADLVVIDEAHHAPARTYRGIIEAYPHAVILGATATPCRTDGRGLGVFDELIIGRRERELTADGYLVPARVYAPSRPDLSGVAVARGDYVEEQLAKVMDTGTLVGDVVTHWLRLAQWRPTVVFATGVAHSQHLANEFRLAGVLAEHLDGSTPAEERDAILARLARGDIDLVSNAMVLTEGWNCPVASCQVLARPTKSLRLYRQMVGRVLRIAPGKSDALILDHAGAVFAHGFPDEPIAWTLGADRRAENPAQTARKSGHTPSLTDCPECHAVRLEGKPCDFCGWRPRPRAVAPDVIDGELAEVGRDRKSMPRNIDAAERRRWHAELVWIAEERGHKPGWAAHKYKDKFGSFPIERDVQPAPPSREVRAWVRSRDIAYRKAMDKQRGKA